MFVFSFVLTLAAAVSSQTAPSARADRPIAAPGALASACAVVTRADVITSLGLMAGDVEQLAAGSASTCDYAGRKGQVSITVQRSQGNINIDSEIAALEASIPGSAAREARGLGDRAFFLDIAGAGTQLYVIRGHSEYLMISVLGFGEAAQVSSAAEAMARKALARF